MDPAEIGITSQGDGCNRVWSKEVEKGISEVMET